LELVEQELVWELVQKDHFSERVLQVKQRWLVDLVQPLPLMTVKQAKVPMPQHRRCQTNFQQQKKYGTAPQTTAWQHWVKL